MSHWYKEDGTACHTVIGKNGKERGTTIRDAREMGLYPSVTTVLQVLAAPELDRWKQKQVLLASLTLPRQPQETEDEFADRIMRDAFKQVDDAADLGTRVHAAIEAHFQTMPWDDTLSPFVLAVDEWVKRNGITFHQQELRIVNKELGYAGTTDALVSVEGKEGLYLLDWKTRKSQVGKKMTPWGKEPMQLAAYAKTLGIAGAANVFISTTEIGRVEDAWYDSEKLDAEFDVFCHALAIWKANNKYYPEAANNSVLTEQLL